jgi:uncharacterized protein YjiS (DUF1127 family)
MTPRHFASRMYPRSSPYAAIATSIATGSGASGRCNDDPAGHSIMTQTERGWHGEHAGTASVIGITPNPTFGFGVWTSACLPVGVFRAAGGLIRTIWNYRALINELDQLTEADLRDLTIKPGETTSVAWSEAGRLVAERIRPGPR